MRPEVLYPLFSDIASLRGVGPKSLAYIQNLVGGRYIADLLFHLPSGVIDRSYRPKLRDAETGRICTVKVRIVEHIAPKTSKQPYRVIVEDDTEQLTLVFFKVYAASIAKNLPVGALKIVSGKLESFNGQLQMTHPDIIADEKDEENRSAFEPVYPLTAGVSNKMMRKYIEQALALVPKLPEWDDGELVKRQEWTSFRESLIRAHHPQNLNDTLPKAKARARLAYDELLANQLTLAMLRERNREEGGKIIAGDGHLRQKVMQGLGFELTDAQKKVLEEIYANQAQPRKMLRLLQGDVGAGKTIVAALAMLNAIEAKTQAALMVPTEILANQHFESLKEMCRDCEVNIALLSGKTKSKERREILAGLAAGEIDIIVGTHALFSDEVKYKNLALAVVDEQHRFGVQQRLKLSQKSPDCDVLVMTATPIPRTLVLSAYGDMDYSVINQLPKGRKPVDTRVLPLSKLTEVVEGLQRLIEQGVMAYWVCPLVEASEKSDLAAAEARFADLAQIFGDKVGLVHGKMKENEKNAVMSKFKVGEIRLLVATTVIEVGVNVPQATVMIIEHAERFGLAQLHQLRGRVKRGNQAARCLLVYGGNLSQTAYERLMIMKKSEDGFEIAEKDLELRGGGEILGTRQSGFENFRLADMEYHRQLLEIANKDAKLIINKDPHLLSKRGGGLRTLLYLFEKENSFQNYKA
ncbi:MAG: ATP-dependent DNA helicase RecG [Alphaproteobacteria bacterium]|nr:ATP-dependent DNA helicase RecG [Alphaproteobacteria bacterium]